MKKIITIPKYSGGKTSSNIDWNKAVLFVGDNEGFRSDVYRDYKANRSAAGKRMKRDAKGEYLETVGYGWTAPEDLHSWTKEAADKRLRLDLMRYDNKLREQFGDRYNSLSSDLKIAMMDVMHQGGDSVYIKKMPSFTKALLAGNMEEAYRQFDFAKSQTTNRHNRRASLFTSGELPPIEPFEPVSTRVQPLIIPNVDRYIDSEVPEMLSWENAIQPYQDRVMNAMAAQSDYLNYMKNNSLRNMLDNMLIQQMNNYNSMFNIPTMK